MIDDAELDAIVAMLSEAGMVEEYVNEDGKSAMRLTPEGAQVARQMALSSEDDAGGAVGRAAGGIYA